MTKPEYTVYTSESCEPCEEVKILIEKGKVLGHPEVEVVDIETDAGWDRFEQEVMNHAEGEIGIPLALREGKTCKILLDTDLDKVVFECPTPDGAPTEEPQP